MPDFVNQFQFLFKTVGEAEIKAATSSIKSLQNAIKNSAQSQKLANEKVKSTISIVRRVKTEYGLLTTTLKQNKKGQLEANIAISKYNDLTRKSISSQRALRASINATTAQLKAAAATSSAFFAQTAILAGGGGGRGSSSGLAASSSASGGSGGRGGAFAPTVFGQFGPEPRRLEELTNKTKKATEAVRKFGLSWSGVARVLLGTIVSNVLIRTISALDQSINQAAEFSVKIAEIRTISQNAQLSTGRWRSEIEALSNEFNKPIFDVAEAAYQALSNQIAEGARIAPFLTDALKLSVAAVSSAESAVLALSSALNAYNDGAGLAGLRSAQFFKIIELGRIRLNQISGTLGNVLVFAQQLGASFEEVGAALTVLTIKGLQPSQAQTFLRGVLIKLANPTEDLIELFEKLGTTPSEAIKTFGFEGTLKILAENVDNLKDIADLFSRIRAAGGAAGLISSFETGEFSNNLNEIKDSVESFDKAVNEVLETTGTKFQRELKKVQNFFVNSLGKDVIEATVRINEAFGGNLLINSVKTLTSALFAAGIAATAFGVASLSIRLNGLILGLIATTKATKSLNGALFLLGKQAALTRLQMAGLFTAVATASFLATNAVLDFLDKAKREEEDYTRKVRNAAAQRVTEREREFEISNRRSTEFYSEQDKILRQGIASIQSQINKFKSIQQNQESLAELAFGVELDNLSGGKKFNLIQAKIKQLFSSITSTIKQGSIKTKEEVTSFKSSIQLLGSLISELENFSNVPGSQNKATFGSTFRFAENNEILKIEDHFSKNTDLVGGIGNRARISSKEIEKLKSRLIGLAKAAETQSRIPSRGSIIGDDFIENLEKENLRLRGVLLVRERLNERLTEARSASLENKNQIDASITSIKVLAAELQKLDGDGRRSGRANEAIEAFKNLAKTLSFDTLGSLGTLEKLAQEVNLFGIALGNADVNTRRVVPQIITTLDILRQDIEEEVKLSKSVQILNNRLEETQDGLLKFQIGIQNIDTSSGVGHINQITEAYKNLNTQLRENSKLNATFGSGGIPNAAGTLSNPPRIGNMSGGYIRRFQAGGGVGSDSVLGLFNPSEFIINARTSRQFAPLLTGLNSGTNVSRFNTGGNVQVGDVNVNITNTSSEPINPVQIGKQIQREISRGLVR